MSLPATASLPAAEAAAPVAWLALAQTLGLLLDEDAHGLQARCAPAPAARISEGFVAALPDLGLLEVAGADARSFLHGQLTNDVAGLPPGQARWFGYCTAKGRLLSVFLGWREDEAMLLTTARPMAPALARRLGMYVLRAKAKVSDRSEERLLLGVGGRAAPAALRALGLEPPAPMAVSHAAAATLVGLPPVRISGRECPRWLLALPAGELAQAWGRLASAQAGLVPVSSEAWRWTEVLAGVPRIVSATAEHFVPQMINLDLSGGVSFDKGCYPGQEVVARTHYLGKQRRRMHLGRTPGPVPAPGSDVLDAAGQPAGRVVLAAAAPEGGVDLLYEAQLAAVAEGRLSVSGAPIERAELPYPLPAP